MELRYLPLSPDVADDEQLARFLTSSSQYNLAGPKPSAFLPSPKDRETSVFRLDPEGRDELWETGDTQVASSGRTCKGAAFVKANSVREIHLAVRSSEPPPKHAVIEGWPWHDADPDLQRAQQRQLALALASKASHLLR